MSQAPERSSLMQNFPNPFNPATTIGYHVCEAGRVTLKVYDTIGRELATLVDEMKEPGRYNVLFDASHLSGGVYFYRIHSGSFIAAKKLLLVK